MVSSSGISFACMCGMSCSETCRIVSIPGGWCLFFEVADFIDQTVDVILHEINLLREVQGPEFVRETQVQLCPPMSFCRVPILKGPLISMVK